MIKVNGYEVYKLPAPEEGAYYVKAFNKPEIVN